MKQIDFHRTFIKRYSKVPKKIQSKFKVRLELFEQNSAHPLLNTHPLAGDRKGEWSINITGDWRAIFVYTTADLVLFIDLDTHSNLYG